MCFTTIFQWGNRFEAINIEKERGLFILKKMLKINVCICYKPLYVI